MRTLLNRREDIRRIKDRLLEPTFGQASLVWQAMVSYP
jgi:hypothetical protein